jgi:hypothetical protein
LDDCIACGTNEFLVVTAATDNFGYCIDITTAHTTAPCDAATKYL